MSAETFRKSLRGIVRGLWQSVITQNQFEDEMSFLLSKELSNAWAEGASECGIKPDEYSDEEQAKLNEFIVNQVGYISGFGDAIKEGNRKNGGNVLSFFERAKLWLNRYDEARSQAKVMACKDQKLKWVINAKGRGCREHCSSCLKLNGKVKRASYWAKVGIRPQGSNLECGGWRCCCGFEVTSEPVYRGQISI